MDFESEDLYERVGVRLLFRLCSNIMSSTSTLLRSINLDRTLRNSKTFNCRVALVLFGIFTA